MQRQVVIALIGAFALSAIATVALIKGDEPAIAMPSAPPQAEIAYSPERDLEAIDVKLIGSAQATIDMDAYVLTDNSVVASLLAAMRRGVKVRVWRETSEPEAEAASKLDERFKEPGDLMHLKSYCVDGKVLRTGAANFSRSGLTRQDNDLIILRIAGACDQFEAKFEKAWGKAE